MKTNLRRTMRWLFVLPALFSTLSIFAQPATVSMPFAVGRTGCTSGTRQIHFYDYNGSTNLIANATTPAPCVPVLKTGQKKLTPFDDSTFTFTASAASVSYNPKDQCIYYLYTRYLPLKTYVWKYPIGTCPTSTSPRLDTLRAFDYDILGVAFDKDGNGWMLDFTGSAAPYTAVMRSIDFTTGIIGPAKNLSLTGGATIYQVGSGDIAISPSGQMFFVVDNKLFTPDYNSYATASPTITCTYIDTVKSPGGNLVGLTYAEGEVVGTYSGSGVCSYREVNPLTGDTTFVTTGASIQSGADFASVISGIGSSKRLVSATPTGTAKQYDVVYDVYVQNYGNYPLANIQVTDNLGAINTVANLSNVSAAFVGAVPPGIALNGAYNGTTNANLLSVTGQNLVAFPAADKSFTIRISCRLSNITSGVTYYNSAVASGTGFVSALLRDSSTNGTLPDLNSNDKPDDGGENQPTPLLIAITPQTPPCTTLGQVFYTQDFGTGAALATLPALPTGLTTYTGSTAQPLAIDQFMIASNANEGDNARFITLTDNTSGTGRMMIVNADAANKIFYSDTVNALCPGQQYSFSFYAAFIGNSSYSTVCAGFGGFKYPRVRMRIRDVASGAIITEIATADITATSWAQYGMKWVLPASYANVIFEMLNEGLGGCGNDIAIDDIVFGTCNAAPSVSVAGSAIGCLGGSTSFSTVLSDPTVIPGARDHQWQVSTDNSTWADISSATSDTYTINPVTAGDVNKYYRVLTAASGNIGSANCRYTSPGYLLTAKVPSVAPTSAVANKTIRCPGDPVTLRVNGGTIGTNASYVWYAGSCSGAPIGTGNPISVSPGVATTYYVRIEGDCNTTTCVAIPITFNCDIDADDDGIPDVVESNSLDLKIDDDFDGLPNWRDADFVGFTDSNGDGVNDNFDSDRDGIPNFMDRDSDNDGIADVVENNGGDADGDGKIDGYTDTDADGFSDNVDANLMGHLTSGSGLGLLDLDSDGIANYLDLDSDNDGVPDITEVFGTDATPYNGVIDGFADTDGDGLANSVDGDADGNGTIENVAGPLLKTGAVLANGRAGSYPNKNMDGDSKANPYDLDGDGDGIADVIEAQFADANANGIIDGTFSLRGWSTTVSALSALNLPNRDGAGRANVFDIDSDDDGIPDNVEGMSTSAYSLPAGIDTDADGIDDTYDNISGFGGKGITVFNKDGDAFPDYLDLDTDGDGATDRVEGNDFNLNGKVDDDVTLTGIDTDGDGLDNKFDTDNASAKGFSRYMGNAGSFTGPVAPGSTAMVQKTLAAFADRDWRQVEHVLRLDFLSFNASLQGGEVHLQWTVFCYDAAEKFIVERSIDGINFTPVASVKSSGRTNEKEKYSGTDDVAALSATTFYYRVKAVEKGGGKYSNIAVVSKGRNSVQVVQVHPNPVHTYLQIGITSAAQTNANLYIYDAQGRLVATYREPLAKGYTTLSYPATSRFANGQYYVKVNMGNEVLTAKFLIQR